MSTNFSVGILVLLLFVLLLAYFCRGIIKKYWGRGVLILIIIVVVVLILVFSRNLLTQNAINPFDDMNLPFVVADSKRDNTTQNEEKTFIIRVTNKSIIVNDNSYDSFESAKNMIFETSLKFDMVTVTDEYATKKDYSAVLDYLSEIGYKDNQIVKRQE
jgi:hypothetical protein